MSINDIYDFQPLSELFPKVTLIHNRRFLIQNKRFLPFNNAKASTKCS